MDIKLDLLDGDIILYQTAYSSAKPKEATFNGWENVAAVAASAEANAERTEEEVKEHVDEFMEELWNKTGGQFYVSFLSSSRADNFRGSIGKSQKYKGNRDNTELPKWFNMIKLYLIEKYNFIQLDTIETDDMLGIFQTYHLRLGKMVPTITTKDKDLKQIKGSNYNWVTEELIQVSGREAYRLLWKQMLIGDTGDNIMGCGSNEWLYWGCKKIVIASGVYKVVKWKKGEQPKTNEFPSKAALSRHIDSLFEDGLKSKKAADFLYDTFGIEQVQRREGVGPAEAEEILDAVKPTQYPGRVLVEYINRFGQFMGVNKFHETFNLVFILRDMNQAMYHGYSGDIQPGARISDYTAWADVINNTNTEENYEDEEF